DFLDFHWNWLSPLFVEGHFPAFNVADSAISVGTLCLLVDELIRVKRAGSPCGHPRAIRAGPKCQPCLNLAMG
ncbi:MAG: hypothetical protein EBT34_14145, partial [Acetobacteraceae bacterium]|nr:hypothetical protein [Acetobacteraceae bacterium]